MKPRMIGNEWVIDFKHGATVEIFGKRYFGVTQIRYPAITEAISYGREETQNMNTEKRPKLRKDIETPLASANTKAGTIATGNPITSAWRFGEWTVTDADCHALFHWFAFVDVCLTCEREVCASCEANLNHALIGEPEKCHGHAPKLLPCPFCGESPTRETMGGDNQTQVGCESCCIGIVRQRQRDAIAAWNRRAK